MRVTTGLWGRALALTVAVVALAAGASASEPQSPRLDRAKDLIADERWVRAIVELRAAAADAKEPSRDEALFWLAHCHNQAGDSASAIEAIHQLERDFPRSRWVKPARSLRIELAQRLNRWDVLWFTAVPPTPPSPPVVEPPDLSAAPGKPAPHPSRSRPSAKPAVAPAPPSLWVAADPDVELRIQAMGSLILSDAEEAAKVIPILRDIALDAENPGQARRALSTLVLSKRPDARSMVVEVAKSAPELVQIEAVRVLGRLRDPEISSMLLHVYADAGEPVKFQIVSSFAQRAETASLLRIAESEANPQLRSTAIMTLGRAPGGFLHLRGMYPKVNAAFKRPVIVGLFNARDDEGLIGIAMRERQVTLRREVLERLRVLGTPRAKQYLEQVDEK